MTAWPYVPGVAAGGHVTSGGAWHPGQINGCVKCPTPPSRGRPPAPRRPRLTTHALTDGCLGQLDLPVRPGFLVAVRVTVANVPRITGPAWLIRHTLPWLTIALPDDLRPGQVVEWASQPDETLADLYYTVVEAITPRAVTFAHFGRDADAALAAAYYANTRWPR
jgi:hypothetical protein